MTREIRILRKGDEALLANVAKWVFDHCVNATPAAELLRDPRHHLAVAN